MKVLKKALTFDDVLLVSPLASPYPATSPSPLASLLAFAVEHSAALCSDGPLNDRGAARDPHWRKEAASASMHKTMSAKAQAAEVSGKRFEPAWSKIRTAWPPA